MTQDQILAALREVVAENSHFTTWTVSTPHLVALVNLAIEREREACAKLCDDLDDDIVDGLAGWQFGEAIRARGTK